MARKLRDLDFVDLYVSIGEERQSYYQIPEMGSLVMQQNDLPDDYREDVAALRAVLEDALKENDQAGVTYDGMRLRVSKAETTRHQVWAAMRRIGELPPALDELGFMLPVLNQLREVGRRDGLVLICGATGQGKTTTASALLYDYLTKIGGVAYTIEDPVEYMLDGRQGEHGLCYQIEVHEDEQWAEELKRSLRWHPRYIMVGEVRTPEAANQLLRAATSGHLVISTMHAGTIEEGMEGILHLAEQAIGDHAPILLASGLTAVMHQKFKAHSVDAHLYVTQQGHLGDPVRAVIRDRKIGQMTTFVDQQMARLSNADFTATKDPRFKTV